MSGFLINDLIRQLELSSGNSLSTYEANFRFWHLTWFGAVRKQVVVGKVGKSKHLWVHFKV